MIKSYYFLLRIHLQTCKSCLSPPSCRTSKSERMIDEKLNAAVASLTGDRCRHCMYTISIVAPPQPPLDNNSSSQWCTFPSIQTLCSRLFSISFSVQPYAVVTNTFLCLTNSNHMTKFNRLINVRFLLRKKRVIYS